MVRASAWWLVGAAAVGCGDPGDRMQSALDPRGPQAESIYDLWYVMFVGSIVVFAAVVLLVIAAVALPRRDRDRQRHLRWVLGGALATTLILAALVLYNATTARSVAAAARDPLEVHITARQWWWDITYVGASPSTSARTANELVIPVGTPVQLTLESLDVIHSFWVPNLHGKRDLIPGRTNQLWIQADAPGVYRGQCAEFCGLQHANMAFLVIAVPQAEFAEWIAHQRRPAHPPADPLAEHGNAVFMRSCAKCHALRGTLAMASVGPDLSHVASRRTLAAATLPHRRGHLAGWITDPQHAKPGVYMPAVELGRDDIHALLHYLESLR